MKLGIDLRDQDCFTRTCYMLDGQLVLLLRDGGHGSAVLPALEQGSIEGVVRKNAVVFAGSSDLNLDRIKDEIKTFRKLY